MTDTVIVFRNAEKPADPQDVDLSPAGRERAARLATYVPQTFGTPDRLFAAARSRHSDRCVETVAPLAAAVGIAIEQDIADRAIDTLVATLEPSDAGAGRTAVVCWHHERIPDLMRALGAPEGWCPDPWPDQLFSLVLVVRFGTGEPPTFDTANQPF